MGRNIQFIDEDNKENKKNNNENDLIKIHANKGKESQQTEIDINSSKLNFESEELYQNNNTQPTDTLKIENICKTFDDGKKALMVFRLICIKMRYLLY